MKNRIQLNWIELSKTQYKEVWDKIDEEMSFKPSITDFPSFTVPSPFITYDISDYFGESVDFTVYDDLEEKALYAFQENIAKNEYMYALDWQHPSYWINPYLEFEKDEFDQWTVPIIPNGDYYFFIHKDFEWGFLGHPWEQTITIFGQALINSFEKHPPRMFQNVVRQG